MNPAANTTSTSVTCEPSILEEVKTSKFSQLGGWYGASLNADCKIEAEYAPRLGYNTSWAPPVATWPGPTTLFEVGGILSMNHVDSLGNFMTWSTTLPELIWYTKDDQWWETYSLYDAAQDKIFTTSMLHMPDLSNLLPDVTDLKTCQRIFWMTTPSTLTYANFLTEYRTLPTSAPVGVVTPGPGAPATPVPGLIIPTVALQAPEDYQLTVTIISRPCRSQPPTLDPVPAPTLATAATPAQAYQNHPRRSRLQSPTSSCPAQRAQQANRRLSCQAQRPSPSPTAPSTSIEAGWCTSLP